MYVFVTNTAKDLSVTADELDVSCSSQFNSITQPKRESAATLSKPNCHEYLSKTFLKKPHSPLNGRKSDS
jgi:hypothetical protein